MITVDILCFGAHPDDVELAMAGTIIKHVNSGKKVGLIDLTKGELGTRGTAETRFEEASNAAKIMGLSARENLDLGDGFFEVNEPSLMKVIQAIRKYKPTIVFCNAPQDRHPDHGRGAELVERACFLSGLIKIETEIDGQAQVAHRPQKVFNYIQDEYLDPDFLVDITEEYDRRVEAIMAYKTQFFNESSNEPETPISSKEFLNFLEGRNAELGRRIGVRYAEGFISKLPLPVSDVTSLA